MNKQNELAKNSLPALIECNLTRIAALKTLSLSNTVFNVWYEQIDEDIKNGIIVDIEKGFKKLLNEKAYGGLDYAVFLEGAKKDLSKEASEQLIMLLDKKTALNDISQKTKSILKEFGGFRYLSEMSNAEVPRFRKEFLRAYIEYGV